MSILNTHNLTVGYRKGNNVTTILSNLDIDLHRGALVALVGANGIGKSTLLRSITGNQQPLSGHVEIGGNPLDTISKKELSRLLGIVNTDRTQAGGLTVRELVSLGRQPYTGFLGILDAYDRCIVSEALNSAGIAHKAECFVAELSDGERQKVMIAKALAQDTPIIILDEPTAFLDVESRMETMLLLHRLAHEQNKAILLSSHDLSQSMMLADELWVITHDRRMLNGNTEDLVLSGAMNDIFTSQNISFDLEHGDYCINTECNNLVHLECHNATLTRWIDNALKRNGFAMDNNASVGISISARSANDFTITTATASTSATSISQLLSILKNSV